METYDILFRVYIWHSYFTNGKCTSFSIIPDESTRRLIQKYGLIFRQTDFGIVVLAASQKVLNETILSDQINTDFQFNFFLTFSNPYLLNITEIETPENNTVHIYTNNLITKDEENENSYSFLSGKQVYLSHENFVLKKELGQEGIFEHNGTNIPINPEIRNDTLLYSAKDLESGVYRWFSKRKEKYYYKSTHTMVSNPFAIISVDFNNENLINKSGTMQHPDYHVRLQTKKTYWQYILNTRQNINKLIIESSDKKEEFEKSEELGADNHMLVIFTSKKEIEITEDRKEYFKLKVRNGSPENDLILISKLPLPEISVLNKKTDEKIYTPIYVNF